MILLTVVILLSWFVTRRAISWGQISIIIVFITFASLVMLYRGNNVLAGVFLGIALCKFTMVWALPLLFLVYRRYTALAIAIGLQVLGWVLMAVVTGESLVDILRTYVDLSSEWTGQTFGVPSLSRWATELGMDSEVVMLGLGAVFALLMAFLIYRHKSFSPDPNLTSAPAQLVANLFATVLILISLSFVYHRFHDMVLTLMVVVFWFNLTELPNRSAIQERAKNLMAVAVALILFANMLPTGLAPTDAMEFTLEAVYSIALFATVGLVVWVAWKYSNQLGVD